MPTRKAHTLITVGILVLLLLGLAAWFNMNPAKINALREQPFSSGCELIPAEYDRAMVYEPLSTEAVVNRLPAQASLAAYAPEAQDQGTQGSSVGWASAYAARTILEAIACDQPAQPLAFSPSSLFNQISSPNCQSASIFKGLQAMKQNGVLPMRDFPYDEHDCSRMPPPSLRKKMGQFNRIGFHRLTLDGHDYRTHLDAIKQNISQGRPVVIGMMVGGSFLEPMNGMRLWTPRNSDLAMEGFFGHAMCIIAYDDTLEGGALQVLNSWGTQWGQQGKAWIRYRDFLHFNKEAYSVFLMEEALPDGSRKVNARLSLINAQSGATYPLNQMDEAVFSTRSKPEQDSPIQLEIANEIPCYLYLYGVKNDGANTLLFPYSPKHSPYFGIQGIRRFPLPDSLRKAGMEALAAIVSAKELDCNKIKQYLNSRREKSYVLRWKNLLGPALPVGFQPQEKEGALQIETALQDNQIVYVILQIDPS